MTADDVELTIPEAAARVGRSVRTIWRYISRDGLTNLGGRVREADLIEVEQRARVRQRAGRRPATDSTDDAS